ncbi:MAG: biliverdin-producing heme oxygenase [Tunicatimonas sp.]
MSLRQQLKAATQPYHDQTERVAGPNDGFTLTDYRTFLLTGWLFHSSLESSLTNSLPQSLKEDLRWPDRLKTERIAQDLHELGVNPAGDLLPLPFTIEAVPQALGALYVAEGSTLGGVMMKKTWAADAAIGPYTSFRFLGCYGTQTGAYWKSFVSVLESTVTDPDGEVAAIATARAAFEFYQACHRHASSGSHALLT